MIENEKDITKLLNNFSNQLHSIQPYNEYLTVSINTDEALQVLCIHCFYSNNIELTYFVLFTQYISRLGSVSDSDEKTGENSSSHGNNVDSKILTETEKISLLNLISPQILSGRIKNKQIKLSLLYRMSRDSKSTEIFHQLCDNKGSTLTIMKTKEFNHVFGGYANVSWTIKGIRQYDPSTILFLLRSQFGHKKKLFPIKEPKFAVYHDKVFGPSFGYDCSLAVIPKPQYDGYCIPQDSFDFIGNSLCGGHKFNMTKQRYNFELEELEVFQVIVKDR